MQAIAGDSAESQRPFKIFLSLLDRWEIGSSLSPRLIIPALEAIRQSLESSPVPDEDVRQLLVISLRRFLTLSAAHHDGGSGLRGSGTCRYLEGAFWAA